MGALVSANQLGSLCSDLNIKYLQDFWGSLLDMTTTVGQTFIDRACGVDISNSIVKVIRFPPTPSELEDPFRCASLAPESSARPRKRGFEEFTEGLQTKLRSAAYANPYGHEQLISSQRGNKRQRKQSLNTNDVGNYLTPIQSSEGFENVALQNLSQTSVLQRSSSIQVNDSQRSPGIKSRPSIPSLAGYWLIHIERNPYGNPLSFSFQSPQGLVSFNQRGNLAIPESPPSRETSLAENPSLLTTGRELGDAKSGSPELDSSVHARSKADTTSKLSKKKGVDDEEFGIHNRSASAALNSPSWRSDHVNAKATDSELQEKLRGQAITSEIGASSSKPKFRLPSRVESNDISATNSKARDIFDPIDTESEKPQELLNPRSIKRLKSNVSLPSKSPGGHQSLREDIHTGEPIISPTLQARKMLPVDLKLLDLHGKNDPSFLANILDQASSPANPVQENINGSVEGPPRHYRPQNLPLDSQNQAGAASEHASITSEQIISTLKIPPKRAVQIINSMEELPSQPQAGLSQPRKSSGVTREVPLGDCIGIIQETSRPDGIEEASFDLSLGQNPKEKQPGESVAMVEPQDPKTLEDSLRGKKSKPKHLGEEKSMAKSADKKWEELKFADKVRQENARREKVLQQIRGEAAEAKPLQGKEKPLKATDAKVRKSKVREEKHKEMKSSEKRRTDEGGRPEPVRAVKPEKARRDQAATETEMQHAVEGRSGSLMATGVSKKPEPVKPATPKSKMYSDVQTHSSVTSNSRNDAGHARKSMTPAFPGPALSKKMPAELMSSIRTPSRQSTNPDPLLQSNSVRTPSTLSRPRAFSKDPSTLSKSTSGSLAETDRKGKKGGTENQRPRDSSRIKKEPSSESFLGTSKHTADKTPKQVKTQTKLNISRDVKGKGRLDDPPIYSKVESQEPIILSSEDEESASSFYSDDEIHRERVKAGPSRKRKGPFGAEFSKDEASAKDISTSGLGATVSKLANTTEKQASPVGDQADKARRKTPEVSKVKMAPKLSTAVNQKSEEPRLKNPGENTIQRGAKPRLQAIKQESSIGERALPPSSIIDSRVGAAIPSSQNSSPRAPAQYMSKPVSISSGSDSNADSEAESESDSEFESETNADARKVPSPHLKPDERNGTASQQKTARNAPKELAAQENSTAQKLGGSSSAPLKANSTSLANSGASQTFNKKNPEREADEQLQRECRQSLGPKSKRASSTSSQPTSDEEPTPSHPPVTNGRSVESRLRLSNYPYPSMTALRERRSEQLRSQHLTNGPVSEPISNKLDPELLALGSSSNSSSNSEDDSESDQPSMVATKAARHNSPKSKPKPFKTMQRILKGKSKNESVPASFAEKFPVADKAKVFTGTQR